MIIDGLELMVYYIEFKIVYSENYENFHKKNFFIKSIFSFLSTTEEREEISDW